MVFRDKERHPNYYYRVTFVATKTMSVATFQILADSENEHNSLVILCTTNISKITSIHVFYILDLARNNYKTKFWW